MRKQSLARLFFLVFLILFTIGCSFAVPGLGVGKSIELPEGAPLTETAMWGIIQTATARADQPQATATPSPTSTVDPFKEACNWAEIVGTDLVPALEPVPPNHALTAKWLLRNVGSCTWDEAYAVVFYSGQMMGGPERYYLPGPVAPGETIEIAFPLAAPALAGQYTGTWKLRDPDGRVLGIGDNPNGSLLVKVNVGGETVTPLPTPNKTTTPTLAPLLLDRCDAVQVMDTLTVPDSRSVPPGSRFTVMWRLRNIGGCTWSRQYAVQFESGNQLNAGSPIYLSQEVPPAGIVDIYAEMRSPITAGEYSGYWKIRNDVNTTFGQGDSFNEPLVASIRVNRSISATPIPPTRTPLPTSTRTPVRSATATSVAPIPTRTRTPVSSVTPTATPGTPTVTPTQTETPIPALFFSFANDADLAVWKDAEGTDILYPGDDTTGKVEVLSSVTLQDGVVYDTDPSIQFSPVMTGTGASIEGEFTLPEEIQDGDRFIVTLGCPHGLTACWYQFIVTCGIELANTEVNYGSAPLPFDILLDTVPPGTTSCSLKAVSLSTPPEDGVAIWFYPRIMR